MKKIVKQIPHQNQVITLDNAIDLAREGKGFVISEYEKVISILHLSNYSDEDDMAVAFFNFNEGKMDINQHSRTEGKNLTEALTNLKKRLLTGEVVNYYYFESLIEFANAVIENQWN